MSEIYVVKIKTSVCEIKKAKDSTTKKIVLTGIVGPDEQKEILVDILRDRGFEEDEDSDGQVLIRETGPVIQIVDLEDMTVTSTIEKETTIARDRELSVRGDKDYIQPEELRAREQAKLDASVSITDEEREHVERELLREISQEFEDTAEERDRELNEVVRDVYTESLKRKAAKMGSITSVSENESSGEDYELRIRITR
jgi:hypothetical protein